MKKQQYNVVVIGYGHIGKRHARLLHELADFNLLAIVDHRYHPAQPDNPYGVPQFKTLDAFAGQNLPADIAVIATPNGLHLSQLQWCIDHGLDMVAEKPVTLESAAVRALQTRAGHSGRNIFPVIQNRYSKMATWLKALLEKQTLGAIYLIQVNCFWNRDERYYHEGSWHGDKQLDGGSLFTQFLHFIDMLYWLFGDIEIIDRALFDFNHQGLSEFEDSGFIRFSFKSGNAMGSLGTLQFTTSAWQKNAESSMTLIAENGSVKIGGQYMEKLEYAMGTGITEADLEQLQSTDPLSQQYGAAAGHYRFWTEIARFYKGESYEIPEMEEAAKVIEIIERIYQQ